MKKLLIASLSINALLIALLTAQAAQAAWTKSEKATVTALEQRILQLEQTVQKNSSQATQGLSQAYDAVKLIQYDRCLDFMYQRKLTTANTLANLISDTLEQCKSFKP